MRTLSRAPLLLVGTLLVSAAKCASIAFHVSYSKDAFAGPFTGRVIVYVSAFDNNPRMGPDWMRPQPMFSKFFKSAMPGKEMIIADDCAFFPGPPSTLQPGEYFVQAVVDRNLGGRAIGSSFGNIYCESRRITVPESGQLNVHLVCDRVVPRRKFLETARTKEFVIESTLLSKFYKRPTKMYAAVGLPHEWFDHPDQKFPIVYEVPGFGGTHYDIAGTENPRATHRAGEPFIYVLLDPDCPTGHCVFADSANNGPWGKALTTELIPALEKKYRAIGTPGTRFVTGHSSGGWSSLWLQVAYPDFFGGCWSTSPDPVDFRDFQQINLYAPNANMFFDENGNPRPIAREGSQNLLFYKPFSDMEVPIRGEQLGSFEAVFSPTGPNGEPAKLWNRKTGAVDPKVAAA